jgi:hypothetical protein
MTSKKEEPDMDEQCELLEKCGFFNTFKGNPQVVKEGWIRLYCSSLAKSEECVRKKIRYETGSPPADNMAPNGMIVET